MGDRRRRGTRTDRADGAGDAVVATPADIVALRASDPAAAHRARLEVREAVGARMAAGWTIVGVDVDGSYVLRLPS